ncbi:hypothetical protein [Methanosarcina barkeri]|uniref:hypothetical protein n=1 Tax=Methanosarcina barkeri TaxID=2208 RepID=UPI0006D1CE44|nr:hypothetical protein [Methanosarcina barkeri]
MEEKETLGSPTSEEKIIPKESEFKASGELETGYTEKSWTKPIDMEGKVIIEAGEKKKKRKPLERLTRNSEKIPGKKLKKKSALPIP